MNNVSQQQQFAAGLPGVDPFPVKHLADKLLKQGVVVRMPNWLGDAVMAIPALMQLKGLIPSPGLLSVICPPFLEPLLSSIAEIDRVVTLTAAHRNWNAADRERIADLKPGIGILFNNSPRDVIALRRCGIPELYGTTDRLRWLLLTRSFKFPKRRDRVLNQLHHTKKYLAMVEALGALPWQGNLPTVRPAVSLEELSPLIQRLCAEQKLLTLSAGAAYGSSKRWSCDSFRTVAQYWLDCGGSVATLGTAVEERNGAEILRGLPEERTYNLAGKTSMTELIYLLHHSALTIANDSGVMHLSALLDRPGIAIFGSTDPSATAPISARWQILFEQQPCAPCFKRECPKGTSECMQAITPEMVIQTIASL